MASSKTVITSGDQTKSSVHSLAKAVTDFSVRIHQNLADDDVNVFFSPFSISTAMSMLLRGAKENSADEIRKLLGFHDANLSTAEVHDSFGEIMTDISLSKRSSILSVANAFVCKNTFKLLSEYKRDLQKIYRASTWEVDFSTGTEQTVKEINNWVRTNTSGMIGSLMDSLDPQTVLILLNAVYFKGSWKYQFDHNETRSENFYNRGLDSMVRQVAMMTMKESFWYVETETYQALELPYIGDDLAMLIVLPKERKGLADLEKSLMGDFLSSIRRNLRCDEVTVMLPKFRLEYSKSMKSVFSDLGLSALFDHRRANLKGLSDMVGLKVSNILHKAVIDVNEEGSEAAAVTSVEVCCTSYVPEVLFTVDHPFLFVIHDKRNNMIYFMGRVVEL